MAQSTIGISPFSIIKAKDIKHMIEIANDSDFGLGGSIWSNNEEEALDIPIGMIDSGKNIYAYYYWLFPNIMLNFYSWGLSINIIEPICQRR